MESTNTFSYFKTLFFSVLNMHTLLCSLSQFYITNHSGQGCPTPGLGLVPVREELLTGPCGIRVKLVQK